MHGLPGIQLLNTVMDPNSKGLCCATVKENTKINHACVYKTSCLCGLFFLSLPRPPQPLLMAKGGFHASFATWRD